MPPPLGQLRATQASRTASSIADARPLSIPCRDPPSRTATCCTRSGVASVGDTDPSSRLVVMEQQGGILGGYARCVPRWRRAAGVSSKVAPACVQAFSITSPAAHQKPSRISPGYHQEPTTDTHQVSPRAVQIPSISRTALPQARAKVASRSRQGRSQRRLLPYLPSPGSGGC